MTFAIIRTSFNILLEVMRIATLCRILTMKSSRVFAVVTMACMSLSLCLQYVDGWDLPRVLVLVPLSAIVFPIAYSIGPLRVRTTRVLLINAAMAFNEASVMNLYTFLAGGVPTDATAGIDNTAMLIVYSLSVPLQAMLYESVVYLVKRHAHSQTASFEPPVIAFLLWSYLLVMWTQTHSHFSDEALARASMASLVYALLSLGFGVVALTIANKDALVGRESANRAASVRQERHLRTGIADSTRRMVAVRHLRHDLANQVEIIEELARHGRKGEADTHLVALQKRALAIVEDSAAHHEPALDDRSRHQGR